MKKGASSPDKLTSFYAYECSKKECVPIIEEKIFEEYYSQIIDYVRSEKENVTSNNTSASVTPNNFTGNMSNLSATSQKSKKS